MSGPQFSVEGVLDALAMQPRRREGAGRSIMFVAARKLEGTTTVKRDQLKNATSICRRIFSKRTRRE